MALYQQRDPQWAAQSIGQSNVTLGQAGCTISALCTLFSFFKIDITPKKAAESWAFTPTGLIIWTQFKNFYYRAPSLNRGLLRQFTMDPRKGSLILIKNGNQYGGNHYLTVLDFGKTATGQNLPLHYWCWDPWDGKKKNVNIFQIVGSAHFQF